MRTLSLGIVAHVDAGKTSLTERLLYNAGVIDEIGSVDDGSTQTDSLALERQRGITIRSAVVSFALDDVVVNLIDTPGHPDFIAEVERVLGVLDGAVLVISAVEGVQPQTRVLLKTLRRLRIPTLIFVNKIDRRGARYDSLLADIAAKLVPAIVPMTAVSGLGARDAGAYPIADSGATAAGRLVEVLSAENDALLETYVEDEKILSYEQLCTELAVQTKRALVHPVFFGSAITGAGVDLLTAAVKELLPAVEGDADGPLSGTVFKVDRGRAGEKVAYIRMFGGRLNTRERVQLPRDTEAKVTAVSVFEQGASVIRASVHAGQIGRVWGLEGVQIGDVIGASRGSNASEHQFAPPSLETVVTARRPSDRGALQVALSRLAEQDPLINLRRDDLRQEIAVSLYGEVQKEVIQATLSDEFGIDVEFRPTTTICVERVVGSGAAYEIISVAANPFLATVGLRVEPGGVGSGVHFQLEVELGSMPYAFMVAVEETVRDTLLQGLYGWQVIDCMVTLTHSGYYARQSSAHGGFDKSMSSTAGDFRNLTPLVLMAALQRAGTRVHEPVHRFRLEVPADCFGVLLPVLAQLGATPQAPEVNGQTYRLEGDVPAARVHELRQLLPTLTSGEGALEAEFDRFELVHGHPPARSRSDHNPLDRKEYLLRVVRRQ